MRVLSAMSKEKKGNGNMPKTKLSLFYNQGKEGGRKLRILSSAGPKEGGGDGTVIYASRNSDERRFLGLDCRGKRRREVPTRRLTLAGPHQKEEKRGVSA